MGDTGSLVIGLIGSVQVIKFNEFNLVKASNYYIGNSPAVSFAIVIVPLVDTLRVITIRLLNGKSPFAPDRNHIHHRLLELVPGQFKVSLILISANTVLIALAFLFNHLDFNVSLQFLAVFVLAILFSFIPSWIL